MRYLKDLVKKLLHIEDKPERTALAFSIGVFLGFSPFLGFHTLAGVIIAFLFKFNRAAILIGVWTNTPWWIIPYYTFATWVGMWVLKFHIDEKVLGTLFKLRFHDGFIGSDFWRELTFQGGLLLSFGIGSLILASLFALVAYPIALRWIRFCRLKRGK